MEDTPEMSNMITECILKDKAEASRRSMFFFTLCLVEVLLNLDCGLVPSCLTQINKDLRMDKEKVYIYIHIYMYIYTQILMCDSSASCIPPSLI